MTRPRGIVSVSLAERGRPELWANEAESAALSGMGAERFNEKLPELEILGFPKKSDWNNKRFIPAIIEFWRAHGSEPISSPSRVADEERAKENWNA